MSERWLKCRIFRGMFSDERAVQFFSKNGETASAFVPESSVRGQVDGQGMVRVLVFQEESTAWAMLPTEDQLFLPVQEGDLVEA